MYGEIGEVLALERCLVSDYIARMDKDMVSNPSVIDFVEIGQDGANAEKRAGRCGTRLALMAT